MEENWVIAEQELKKKLKCEKAKKEKEEKRKKRVEEA